MIAHLDLTLCSAISRFFNRMAEAIGPAKRVDEGRRGNPIILTT